MRPVLLILASGQAEYRQYMLKWISRRYDIVLLATKPVSWEQPFIVEHAVTETGEHQALLTAASGLARRHRFAGVLTYLEPFVELAALIAESLGVPRCDTQALARCRDKLASRRAFQLAGVPSAQATLVTDGHAAELAAGQIGYPVIVKPRSLAASFGVSVAAERSALAAAFDCARGAFLPDVWDHRGDVLIEEYLDGPEISVDAVVVNGRVQPLIYARKELGFAPYFEEIGHIVGPPEKITRNRDAVDAAVTAAHLALGVDNIATHTELRITRSGPRIVEVNGRSGGDLIPYLGYLAAGVNLPLASADVAASRAPKLAAAGHGVAGIRFFYPPEDGRVEFLGVTPGFAPSWLDQLTWLVRPGTEVQLPPRSFYSCRLGFAVVTAESVEQCASRLLAVEREVIVKLSPSPRSRGDASRGMTLGFPKARPELPAIRQENITL